MLKVCQKGRKKISKKPLKQIAKQDIDRISAELDPMSRAVVSYIWQNRFATIEELSSLCEASNHMEVLLRIKEIINPLAERMIGSPLLIFEKSKIDIETGKKILFNWWLMDGERVRRSEFLDIIDEGNHLRIIMELFGVSEENIQLVINQDKLIIFADSSEGKYQEEILLPIKVNLKEANKLFKNGILEVILEKDKNHLGKHSKDG